MTLKKVAFTMYPVLDMPRAQQFYEQILQLRRGSVYGNGAWVEYDLPQGGCLALTTMTDVTPSSTAGGSIAFEVDNLPKLVQHLKAQGVPFKKDIFESPLCHIAVIQDTEGNAITLHALKRHT